MADLLDKSVVFNTNKQKLLVGFLNALDVSVFFGMMAIYPKFRSYSWQHWGTFIGYRALIEKNHTWKSKLTEEIAIAEAKPVALIQIR